MRGERRTHIVQCRAVAEGPHPAPEQRQQTRQPARSPDGSSGLSWVVLRDGREKVIDQFSAFGYPLEAESDRPAPQETGLVPALDPHPLSKRHSGVEGSTPQPAGTGIRLPWCR